MATAHGPSAPRSRTASPLPNNGHSSGLRAQMVSILPLFCSQANNLVLLSLGEQSRILGQTRYDWLSDHSPLQRSPRNKPLLPLLVARAVFSVQQHNHFISSFRFPSMMCIPVTFSQMTSLPLSPCTNTLCPCLQSSFFSVIQPTWPASAAGAHASAHAGMSRLQILPVAFLCRIFRAQPGWHSFAAQLYALRACIRPVSNERD